jgi:hypothetical protein
MDYDHNAPSFQHLRDTHERFYKIIREKRPDLPIVMASSPDSIRAMNADARYSKSERRAVIIETYTKARAAGDKNVYFVDGESFYQNTDWDYCSVDGCHPNDMGFYYMAKGFLPTLRKILK